MNSPAPALRTGRLPCQLRPGTAPKWMVIRWVETDREIAMDNLPHAEELAEDLMRVAEQDGYDAEKDKIRGVVLLDVRKFGLRFQRLVLFPKR